MKRGIRNLALIGLAGLAMAGVIRKDSVKDYPYLERNIKVQTQNGVLNVPDYDFGGVYCSWAAGTIADELFGLNYSDPKHTAAWERVGKDRVVGRVNSFEELEGLIDSGVVKPGTLLGLYFDKSKHNKQEREFTHNAVYLGRDLEGHALFGHYFPNERKQEDTLIDTPKSLEDKGLSPRVVFAPKNLLE